MRGTATSSNSSSTKSDKTKASSNNGGDSSSSSNKGPGACSRSSSSNGGEKCTRGKKSGKSKDSSDEAQDHITAKGGLEKKNSKGDIACSSSSNRVEDSGIDIGVSRAILAQVEDLLELPGFIYARFRKSFVLCTWQHYKAYLSAHTSYTKALMKLLLVIVERGLEAGLDEEGEGVLSALMASIMKSTLGAELAQYLAAGGAGAGAGEPAAAAEGTVSLGEQQQEQRVEEQVGLGRQEGVGCGRATTAAGGGIVGVGKPQRQQQEQQVQQHGEHQVGAPRESLGVTSSTIHLLLLLGAARAIVSVGRAFLSRLEDLQRSAKTTTTTSGSSGNSSSSNKESGTTGVSGSSTADGVGSIEIQDGDTGLTSTGLSFEARSAAQKVILAQLTAAALQLQECLAHWQQNAAAVGTLVTANPSSSSAAAADGAAASAAATKAASGAATTASASGVGFVSAVVSLPERFSWVPSQGLPEAVAEQLDLFGRKWWKENDKQERPLLPRRDMEAFLRDKEVAWQLAVLRDLVLLCEVLLAEVPCPLGCSNPACVNLGGESEVRVAHKACAACKVVYYCSRRCQVDHWKAGHGKICGQMGPAAGSAVKEK